MEKGRSQSRFLYREQFNPDDGGEDRINRGDRSLLGKHGPHQSQSLNRYAYVGNSPCNQTDPLGLAQCDFNVQLNNDAGLTGDQIGAIEQRINQNSWSSHKPEGRHRRREVQFQRDSRCDPHSHECELVHQLPMEAAREATRSVPKVASGGPKIYMNNLPGGFPAADTAMQVGGVGAHELAHFFTGSGDLPYDPANPNLFMFYDAPVDAQLGAKGTGATVDAQLRAKGTGAKGTDGTESSAFSIQLTLLWRSIKTVSRDT